MKIWTTRGLATKEIEGEILEAVIDELRKATANAKKNSRHPDKYPYLSVWIDEEGDVNTAMWAGPGPHQRYGVE